MENEQFVNLKLQRLYEALSELFSTGWQDIGEEECEMICLPITLRKNDGSDWSEETTLWISKESLEVFLEN